MLDVHPAHHAATTWRDFFIHIATIVIGLLIAISLEQAVEWLHHRQQVRETREAIHREREENQRQFERTSALFRLETKQLETNLADFEYLVKHPGAPVSSLPGPINWHNLITSFDYSAWETAQHDNVTALMPQPEVRQSEELYSHLQKVQRSCADRLAVIGDARLYTASDSDPSTLTPQQIQQEIRLTQAVIIAHYRMGGDMRNLNLFYPDFTPSPTTQELHALVHEEARLTENEKEMSVPTSSEKNSDKP
jgi:hypothetical protein